MSTHEREHFARIVAILLSANIKARVIQGGYYGVQVYRDNESILWSNVAPVAFWSWTSVDLTTGITTTGWTDLAQDASPYDVALVLWQTYAVDDLTD